MYVTTCIVSEYEHDVIYFPMLPAYSAYSN